MVWKFSKSGDFEFACLIPGHREAGMVGTVVVK
ncbi:plastocyanin/azurin family copper-binding protein [Acinetobacter baumannii]